MPLWFAELNPSKINFGLALYGRGYTLKDKTCNKMLCAFSGPSNPGVCTNNDGVMSLVEIQQLIKQKGLTPRYNADAMMKELTWDDQWIGYDDADTIKAKKGWADNQCFGGTMAWSIDFNSGNGEYGFPLVFFFSPIFGTIFVDMRPASFSSGLEPKPTTDGTCGKGNGNTICKGWPNGNCCSG